jgi:hypothetical protein
VLELGDDGPTRLGRCDLGTEVRRIRHDHDVGMQLFENRGPRDSTRFEGR